MSKIEELIRIKKADPTYTILRLRPGPDGWERCECPFCGRKRAQIHDHRGLFWCPHESCHMRFAVVRSTLIDSYDALINKLVRHNQDVRKYGKWLPAAEAKQFCELQLLEYEASWQLADWEAQCCGDQGKLNGYVYTALKGDVLNYARDKVSKLRGEALTPDAGEYRSDGDDLKDSAPAAATVPPAREESDQDGQRYTAKLDSSYYAGPLPRRPRRTVRDAEDESDDAGLDRYPVLGLRYGDKLTIAKIAKAKGKSTRWVDYQIRAEKNHYLGKHPSRDGRDWAKAPQCSGMAGSGGRGAREYGPSMPTVLAGLVADWRMLPPKVSRGQFITPKEWRNHPERRRPFRGHIETISSAA
jgi:hypothetical protein